MEAQTNIYLKHNAFLLSTYTRCIESFLQLRKYIRKLEGKREYAMPNHVYVS